MHVESQSVTAVNEAALLVQKAWRSKHPATRNNRVGRESSVVLPIQALALAPISSLIKAPLPYHIDPILAAIETFQGYRVCSKVLLKANHLPCTLILQPIRLDSMVSILSLNYCSPLTPPSLNGLLP